VLAPCGALACAKRSGAWSGGGAGAWAPSVVPLSSSVVVALGSDARRTRIELALEAADGKEVRAARKGHLEAVDDGLPHGTIRVLGAVGDEEPHCVLLARLAARPDDRAALAGALARLRESPC